jgi:CheY-like chemotaxis protein
MTGSPRATRVLLVEDEVLFALGLKADLTDLGYEVELAVPSGIVGLEKYRLYGPEVVLVDIRLAGSLTGAEVAREIRQIGNPVIIFVTGYPLAQVARLIEEFPDVAVLAKPIDARTIDHTIRKALARATDKGIGHVVE